MLKPHKSSQKRADKNGNCSYIKNEKNIPMIALAKLNEYNLRHTRKNMPLLLAFLIIAKLMVAIIDTTTKAIKYLKAGAGMLSGLKLNQ